jgi:hypothetical protein
MSLRINAEASTEKQSEWLLVAGGREAIANAFLPGVVRGAFRRGLIAGAVDVDDARFRLIG